MPPKKGKKIVEVTRTPTPEIDGSSGGGSVASSPASPETATTPLPDTKAPKKKATPKRAGKKAEPKYSYQDLPDATGGAAPIDVAIQTEDDNGSKKNEDTGFVSIIKLHGLRPFHVTTSILLDQGPYAGHQAILVLPDKPFRFMELTTAIRAEVLRYVLAPQGAVGGRISILGPTNKTPIAHSKEYTETYKNRLGVMRVCRDITGDARAILYSSNYKFDTTATLLQFLIQIGDRARNLLTLLEVTTYQKTSAMNAFTMLGDCRSLQRLHFSTGVASNATPQKAAKALLSDCGRFLDMQSLSNGGNRGAAVDIIRFGRTVKCFSIKEGNEVRAWTDEEKQQFSDLLQPKAK